jgi:pimeloyl-ACP methyl ester carboxylesterase
MRPVHTCLGRLAHSSRRGTSSGLPRTVFWLLPVAMLLAMAVPAQAKPGDLDRGLGSGGRVTAHFGRYTPSGALKARFGFTDHVITPTSGAPPMFQSASCPPEVFPPSVSVDCGFVVVPENRARPSGRAIRVAAAVMHAPSSHPKQDPIVFLDGGPSFGAISSFAVDTYFGGASYTRDRDVILVDTRGTGLSEPRLGCPEFDRAHVSTVYSKPFVGSSAVADFSRAIRACRDRLAAAGIDLAAYNSAESAADLEALRRALGYRQWNLFALSADGVLGLTYMRLFPGGIRSAVIDSGMSPQHLWGLDYYGGLNQLLERAFAGCAANAACNAAYPNLRGVFFDLVHRLQAHPAVIPIPDFQPRPVTIRVDGVVFYFDSLFGIFPGNEFAPDSIRPLLSEIWRAAHGQLTQVYQDRLGTGPETSDADSFLAEGKTMSYVCRDLVGFITRADLRQAARDLPELAPLFLDPNFDLPLGWVPPSPAGCRLWKVGVADPAQHQPVRSSIPTLVLAGEYDSGVPPLIVRQIPPTLRTSFYYEFPAAPHIQLANDNPVSTCARSIAGQFLKAPTTRPNSSCIRSLPQFDFTP